MAEPNTTAVVIGAGLAPAVTFVLGPVLGEFAIIIGMGLLGTLVALSDINLVEGEGEKQHVSWGKALLFVFRGMSITLAFSLVFTAVITHFIPASFGVTPYAVISTVSFILGWTSGRATVIRDAFVAKISSLISSFGNSNKS